jgi:hypothetical protein
MLIDSLLLLVFLPLLASLLLLAYLLLPSQAPVLSLASNWCWHPSVAGTVAI